MDISQPFKGGDKVELLKWVYDSEGIIINNGTIGTVTGKPFGSAYNVIFPAPHEYGLERSVVYALVSENYLRKYISPRNRSQRIYDMTLEKARNLTNKELLDTYCTSRGDRHDDDSWYVCDAYREAVLGRMGTNKRQLK